MPHLDVVRLPIQLQNRKHVALGAVEAVVGWSLTFSSILTGLYVAGSNFVECGKSSSKITISYLSDAAEIESGLV